MSKQVVTQEKHEVVGIESGAAWGTENVSQADIIIPRILVCQAMSDAVKGKKATSGDIVRTPDSEVLAKEGEKMPFIVVSTFTDDVHEVRPKGKQQWEWKGSEAHNPAASREWVEGDMEHRLVKQLNFYVLLLQDLKEGLAMPHIISTRMTAMRSGRQLATYIAMSAAAKLPACEKVYTMETVVKTKDKNSWYVPSFSKAGIKTSTEHQKIAYDWFLTMKSNKLKVADDEAVDSDDGETNF